MLKKEYAQKLDVAIRAIEYIYYDHLDYHEEDAHKAALNQVGLTEKQYQAVRDEARK